MITNASAEIGSFLTSFMAAAIGFGLIAVVLGLVLVASQVSLDRAREALHKQRVADRAARQATSKAGA